jgi:hypothetical protein
VSIDADDLNIVDDGRVCEDVEEAGVVITDDPD